MISLIDILILGLKNKRKLIGIPLATAVLLFIIVSFLPKIYYTESRLRIDDPNSQQMMMMLGTNKNLSSLLGKSKNDEPTDLYLELLNGRNNLFGAIHEFKLDSVYKIKIYDLVLKKFRKTLTIDVDDNGIVFCGIEGENRELNCKIVNYLVCNANQRYTTLQKERLALNTRYLSDERKQLIDTLESMNEELVGFYHNNNVVNIEKQIEYSLAALASYEDKLKSLEIEQKFSSDELAKNTPRMQENRRRINILQKEFDALRGGNGTKFQDTSKPTRSSIYLNPDWGLNKLFYERTLTTRLEIAKDFLAIISKELALTESELSRDIPVVQVIQPPYIPDWKVKPKRIHYALLGWLVAFTFVSSYLLLNAFLSGELKGDAALQKKVLELLKSLRICR
jgi:capsule polysaccharide export protein KpsE/RkpR